MCAIDHRLYQWLGQCGRAMSVDETSLTLLSFTSLFEDIMMHRFYDILPLSVKKLQRSRGADNKGVENNRDSKRQRKAEVLRNDNIPSEWKIQQGESWDNVFRNKTLSGPDLECGSKFCLKFWVKGICFSDCKQKASHEALSDEDKQKGDSYIKELRGE